MNNSYKEYFYTSEMIAAMGGVENVDRYVKRLEILDRRFRVKRFFRKSIVVAIKLVLILGIIVLLFKIFM